MEDFEGCFIVIIFEIKLLLFGKYKAMCIVIIFLNATDLSQGDQFCQD